MGITQKVGSLGEELAVKFLMKRGFVVIDRNYRRPWGELDIVAEKKQKIHFVEVKAMSHRFVSDETEKGLRNGVSSETSAYNGWRASLLYVRSKIKKDRFRPEDHVNAEKIKRLARIIQTYLGEKHVSSETNWQFDVVTVLIDRERKKAKVEFLEDITL